MRGVVVNAKTGEVKEVEVELRPEPKIPAPHEVKSATKRLERRIEELEKVLKGDVTL